MPLAKSCGDTSGDYGAATAFVAPLNWRRFFVRRLGGRGVDSRWWGRTASFRLLHQSPSAGAALFTPTLHKFFRCWLCCEGEAFEHVEEFVFDEAVGTDCEGELTGGSGQTTGALQQGLAKGVDLFKGPQSSPAVRRSA